VYSAAIENEQVHYLHSVDVCQTIRNRPDTLEKGRDID
jgi:hypothetical protein